MASLEEFNPLNSSGDTKSTYTSIDRLASCISKLNRKPLFVDDVELDSDMEDGMFYFVKTDATGRTYTLPPVAENDGMEVFIQHTTGAASVTVETAGVSENIILPAALLTPSNSKDLDTPGDFLHLICDGEAWYAIGHFIA